MFKINIMFMLTAATAVAANYSTAWAQNKNTAFCDEKLVSYANWKETPSTEWSLHITAKNGGSLHYIGAQHADDTAHAQFQQLRQVWKTSKPTLAFFEGPDRGIADSEEETIKKFGESGFVRFMAKAEGIKTMSLEPGPQQEVDYILSLDKYTPEQVKLFFILREASRLRERKGLNEEQIKETIAQLLLKANSLVPAFAAVLPDVASLQPAYKKFWSAPANWWEAPAEWFTPGGDGEKTGGKFTHDINRYSSEFRNLHMYRLVTDAVLRGEKSFCRCGP